MSHFFLLIKVTLNLVDHLQQRLALQEMEGVSNVNLSCWQPHASCSSCVQTLDNHPENITIIFGEVERTVLGVSAILFAIFGTIANAVLLAALLVAPR